MLGGNFPTQQFYNKIHVALKAYYFMHSLKVEYFSFWESSMIFLRYAVKR